MAKSYHEMMRMQDFTERYRYLRLFGRVGKETFGGNRYLNQAFYSSDEWNRIRNQVIIRDNGCDLAVPGREIYGMIYVHHINPITYEDIIEMSPKLTDLDNLVCTSRETHEAIHYGDEMHLRPDYKPRRPNDTCPWKD